MWAAAIKVIIDIGNPVASDLSGLVTPAAVLAGRRPPIASVLPRDYRTEIEALIKAWRPEIWPKAKARQTSQAAKITSPPSRPAAAV